jgi:hypothetical protein
MRHRTRIRRWRHEGDEYGDEAATRLHQGGLCDRTADLVKQADSVDCAGAASLEDLTSQMNSPRIV